MKKLTLLGSVAALLALTLAPAQLSAQTRLKWDLDGVERTALIFPPSQSESGKVPLVFAFHGHGGNALSASRVLDIQNKWPQALVVFMMGVPTAVRTDPKGEKPGWQREPGELGDRDVKFFDTVLATMKEKYPVDANRVYASGFSNGGIFDFLLWDERGKTFAAFGICAGYIMPSAHPKPARPLIYIGGTHDPLVTPEYQHASVDYIKGLNGCKGEGKPWRAEGSVFFPSSKGTPVVVVTHQGGHIVPNTSAAEIVEFFKEHSLANK